MEIVSCGDETLPREPGPAQDLRYLGVLRHRGIARLPMLRMSASSAI